MNKSPVAVISQSTMIRITHDRRMCSTSLMMYSDNHGLDTYTYDAKKDAFKEFHIKTKNTGYSTGNLVHLYLSTGETIECPEDLEFLLSDYTTYKRAAELSRQDELAGMRAILDPTITYREKYVKHIVTVCDLINLRFVDTGAAIIPCSKYKAENIALYAGDRISVFCKI